MCCVATLKLYINTFSYACVMLLRVYIHTARAGIFSTVARHIFQACRCGYIYTQSNITQASYSPEYINTPIQQIFIYLFIKLCQKHVTEQRIDI
jgi:hypothetical protein